MATNTQVWINLYLASDWRDWILEQKAYKGHSQGVTGVAGAVQAVLIHHPNLVIIIGLSMFKSFPCHLRKHIFEF